MATPVASGLFAAAETGHALDKDEYEAALPDLRVELLNLQYDLRSADFPLILLVVGDDRPGCVDVVHALHEWMDARYIETHVLFAEPSDEERQRPWAWRYWRRLPRDGGTALFLGAWPAQVVSRALAAGWSELELDGAIDHVERFERQLVDDGALLLKFWLHQPKAILEKSLARARKHPKRHWRLDERDWEIFEEYDRVLPVVERVVRRTGTAGAPWQIVESTDRRYGTLTVARAIAAGLRDRLESGPRAAPEPVAAPVPPAAGERLMDAIDLSAALAPEDYEALLARLQARLNELSRSACDAGISCVMVFEGVDAAGKGGSIRRVTWAMPLQAVRVVPIAAPSEEERAHHYLWRFWRLLPADGHTVVFDRSWYGRVLVERVEGFAREHEWRRAYDEINDFEAQIHQDGTPVLKFWLQIDPDEQLRRFEARSRTPYKKYKLTDEDYRNREKWDLYQQAAHDMVALTSTAYAPWHLIPANDKRFARIEVLRTVCEAFDERLAASVEKRAGRPKKRPKGKKGRKRRRS